MPAKLNFASDNNAPVHPRVMDALREANQGHAPAYGDDPWTEQLGKILTEEFGPETSFFPVFNGTGANVLSLASALQSFEHALVSDLAHLNSDECGAPEKFTGSKLVSIPTKDGKFSLEDLTLRFRRDKDPHHTQAGLVSLTQSTEYGTVYSSEEIEKISYFSHQRGMKVHMDGARLANAAAALGVGLRALTRDLGVDLLSLGGTKNGLMGAELILCWNEDLAMRLTYLRKQAMQLSSKMRFLSAQFLALFRDDLWLQNARHANEMAQRLSRGLTDHPRIRVSRPVQANAVFAQLDSSLIQRLQKDAYFYVWDEALSEVRWMTSFSTSPEDVDRFLELIHQQG